MSKLESLTPEALASGPSSPGITRGLAFEGEGCRVLRSRAAPGTTSGWHHHGDYDVYGYVVSGTVRLESGAGGKDAISIGPGGFLHVPSKTIHREINPSSDEGAEVILFLRGTGQSVVNVEGPNPA